MAVLYNSRSTVAVGSWRRHSTIRVAPAQRWRSTLQFYVIFILWSACLRVDAKIHSSSNVTKSGDEENKETIPQNIAHSEKLPLQSNRGYGQKQMAYTLKLAQGECTGVLIHKDWILSAAHCLGDLYKEAVKDDNGVLVMEYPVSISAIGGGSIERPTYIDPLTTPKHPKKNGTVDGDVWRMVHRWYFLPTFRGESQIFKGNDLVLGKLDEQVLNQPSKYLAPLCLPDPEKPDLKADYSDELFFSGLGQRRSPHCITDIYGPDKAGICGRPKECSKDPRANKCGLEFLYKGKLHNKCITDQTPSADNELCQQLLTQTNLTGTVGDFLKNTYIFDDQNKLLTVCYQNNVKQGKKGWCTTRDPWNDENQEPKPDSGWGFCGEDDYQKECDAEKEISDVLDTSLYPVNILHEEYCFKHLKKNLAVELPEVVLEDENNYLGNHNIICVGKNITRKHSDFQAFSMKNGTFEHLDFEKVVDIIPRDEEWKTGSESVLHNIAGSGGCFGDAGAPLVKYVGDKPVLIGTMSFLLWGACQSRFEPIFYTRIDDQIDFILKQIPKGELCFG